MDRGYNPWSCKESDTTESLTLLLSSYTEVIRVDPDSL